jgi:citrate lyase subunit beta/citryl-CoA lyase
VRVNAPDTEWGYEDLVEVVRGAGDALDVVIVPKVRGRDDVVWVDRLLTALERGVRRARPIALEVLVEEAEALATVETIATASPRLEALILGSGDLAASQGIRQARIGAFRGDVFGYARQRVVVAARAAGIDAVDGPYWGPVDDDDGYRAECEQSAILGFAGKWAIHPAQIPLANAAFSPTAEEVDAARRTRERYRAAMRAGRGAVAVDGVMIDMVDLRLADAVLAQADRVEGRRRR